MSGSKLVKFVLIIILEFFKIKYKKIFLLKFILIKKIGM